MPKTNNTLFPNSSSYSSCPPCPSYTSDQTKKTCIKSSDRGAVPVFDATRAPVPLSPHPCEYPPARKAVLAAFSTANRPNPTPRPHQSLLRDAPQYALCARARCVRGCCLSCGAVFMRTPSTHVRDGEGDRRIHRLQKVHTPVYHTRKRPPPAATTRLQTPPVDRLTPVGVESAKVGKL